MADRLAVWRRAGLNEIGEDAAIGPGLGGGRLSADHRQVIVEAVVPGAEILRRQRAARRPGSLAR